MPVLRRSPLSQARRRWEISVDGEQRPQGYPHNCIAPKHAADPHSHQDGQDTNEHPREKQIEVLLSEARERSYREGFEQGYKEGVQRAEEGFKEELSIYGALVHSLATELGNQLRTFMAKVEASCADVVIEVARKIFEIEAIKNEDVVKKAVNEALRSLAAAEAKEVVLRVNPMDEAFVMECTAAFVEALNGALQVRVVPDKGIERGGVVAESERGVVDLQPSTRLGLLASEVQR